MLSPDLVFERRQTQGSQPAPYPLKFHPHGGARKDYPRYDRTTEPEYFGARVSE